MLAPLTFCVLGFASGVRHALEPDHLAAVSSLVCDQRGARATVRYAAAWGAGHAAMLVLVGGALAVMEKELPRAASDALELVVALVLVALGVRGIGQAFRAGRAEAPRFAHSHGASAHTHAGPSDHLHLRSVTFARLPFLVGVVHGLAGSGAMTALVASHVGSPVSGVSFIAVYAIGAAAGMSTLAGVLGWPLARLVRTGRALQAVVGASAIVSLVVGVAWGAPILGRAFGLAG
jgi:hypothetical protein